MYFPQNFLNKIRQFLPFVALLSLSFSASAQSNTAIKTDTFFVNGNCEMCKARIEKALDQRGVKSFNWNAATQQAIVTYRTDKVNLAALQAAVAKAGHDSPGHNADTSTYANLPACCQYERK